MSELIEDLFKDFLNSSGIKGVFKEIEKRILYVIQQLQITYDLTALLFKFAHSAMQTQIFEGNKQGPYHHIMLLNVSQNAGFATE